MENSEKRLVFESKFQMEILKSRIEKGKKIAELIYSQQVEFPFLDLDDFDFLKEFIKDPRKTILKSLEKQSVEIDEESGVGFLTTSLYGMEVDPEKAISLLKAPIINLIKKINELDKEAVLDFLAVAKWDDSDPANQRMIIDEDLLEKLKDRYRTYADTPRKKEFLETYERFVNAANEMVKLGVPVNQFMNHPGRFYFAKNKERLEISPKFFTVYS